MIQDKNFIILSYVFFFCMNEVIHGKITVRQKFCKCCEHDGGQKRRCVQV
jgi:hypothetical protein